MKIVILDEYTINPGDLSWSRLEKYGELTVYKRTPKELVVPRIGDAEIVMTSKCVLTAEVLSRCPNLKWIGVLATGYNMVDLEYASSHNIPVTNIPAYSTDSVAQFTFSLLLEICNRVGVHSGAVNSGKWQDADDFCFTLTTQIELAGKTFGVIGYGSIGRRVSKIAEAMGMKVLIASKYPDPAFESEHISFTSLDELFAASDMISLHCPLREDNKGFINKDSISKMKDGVILLNTSRGPLINEEDLAQALRSGKVSAAGLDVLSVEPPRDVSPLIGLPNCIVTPHIAWITRESRARLIDTAVSNLESYLTGKSTNCVNDGVNNKYAYGLNFM
ncbi:MAG TPA: D-2-hydroxyacid dehydrogenase [Anaerovoracaceae bacterium]|nr:D-2-hydroxyacid dehydrogenase [Anaerovoracaceae bacterium]